MGLLTFIFFFPPRFCLGHISGTVTRRDSKLSVLLLAETPNWVCCLVLRSNFALLLTIQFASLISSLTNIISLLLTTFDWTKVEMRRVVCVEFFIFGGLLLGRIQGDREPVSSYHIIQGNNRILYMLFLFKQICSYSRFCLCFLNHRRHTLVILSLFSASLPSKCHPAKHK